MRETTTWTHLTFSSLKTVMSVSECECLKLMLLMLLLGLLFGTENENINKRVEILSDFIQDKKPLKLEWTTAFTCLIPWVGFSSISDYVCCHKVLFLKKLQKMLKYLFLK